MTVKALHYRVSDLGLTRQFYGDVLGFEVADEGKALICSLPNGARLVFHEALVERHVANKDGRYWKIGLTMPDLDRAVAHLDRMGWAVSRPRQFLDIGYMCHLNDPDGLPLELLQQGVEGRATPGPEGHDIGAQATLAHLTLRAETREVADREWLGAGMTLMSVQPVPSHGFTLYFYCLLYTSPSPRD